MRVVERETTNRKELIMGLVALAVLMALSFVAGFVASNYSLAHYHAKRIERCTNMAAESIARIMKM